MFNTMTHPNRDIDRARGCLWGLAVGDAVGTTKEFSQPDQPDFPALATGPQVDLVGGGPFALPVGAVTDDTQMAVCLARAVAANRRHPVDEAAALYVTWMHGAFDVGNQTRAALSAIARGASPHEAGHQVWEQSGRNAAGNGSLMRIAALAAGYAMAGNELGATMHGAMADSAITHADPRCQLACASYAAAIWVALRRGADASAMMTAARAALGEPRAAGASAHESDAGWDAARAALLEDLDAAAADNPRLDRAPTHLHQAAGFVRVAYRYAFWHLLHTADWRAAILDAANRGGDADTNAAIIGALLGARDGIAAIPADWLAKVQRATLPGPAAWAEAHHPRHLELVLERALTWQP